MKKYLTIASCIVGLAWIPLFIWDWKIAGLIMLVMWANNIMIKADNIK